MHWKIKRDPYYSELWPVLGDEGVREAGFFEDSSNKNFAIEDSLLCPATPLAFEYQEHLKLPAVLLSTGAFCPIHCGHIDMMTRAKAQVESQGFKVIAGYLSPGHDEYIEEKLGKEAIPIHQRIAFIHNWIETKPELNWLRVDPWEGVFAKVAVNFTEVLYRLEQVLEQKTGQKVPVFYVCGGDNARFSLTFLKKGHAVVVGRPTYENRFEQYQQQFEGSNRVFFIEGKHPAASTKVRKNWSLHKPQPIGLRLRLNGNDSREAALIKLLQPYFSNIKRSYLNQQKEHFKKFDQTEMISLDPLLTANYNLGISRIYDRFGCRLLGYGPRPGSAPLKTQLDQIPKGKYQLFDDDQHSGGTIRYAKQLLTSKGIQIKEVITLEQSTDDFPEISDARDFFIGGRLNGLVQKWGDKLLRVPYCYPFVCPFHRASIPQPMEFSKAIWGMNRDYFLKNNQQLKDLPEIWQWLFIKMEFGMEDWLSDICQKQYDDLEIG